MRPLHQRGHRLPPLPHAPGPHGVGPGQAHRRPVRPGPGHPGEGPRRAALRLHLEQPGGPHGRVGGRLPGHRRPVAGRHPARVRGRAHAPLADDPGVRPGSAAGRPATDLARRARSRRWCGSPPRWPTACSSTRSPPTATSPRSPSPGWPTASPRQVGSGPTSRWSARPSSPAPRTLPARPTWTPPVAGCSGSTAPRPPMPRCSRPRAEATSTRSCAGSRGRVAGTRWRR